MERETEKTVFDYKKFEKQNFLSMIFMAIVLVGSIGIGVLILLSEILYAEILNFFACPMWYQIALYVLLFIIACGIVGCIFSRNKQNTTKIEVRIELAVFWIGFIFMLIFAFMRDSRINDMLICVGGAICAVGFFCGIGGVIGTLKKSKRNFVFAEIYYDLCDDGLVSLKNFAGSGASISKIKKVEKYFKTPLPDELSEFLFECDGDGELLFSAKEIIETARKMRSELGGSVYVADKLCYIGSDASGNYFCYRIGEDGIIDDQKIYSFNHETKELKFVAKSLTELIEKYYRDKL